jgi:hypothetical protein
MSEFMNSRKWYSLARGMKCEKSIILILQLLEENAKLRKQLELWRKLSEERRLALKLYDHCEDETCGAYCLNCNGYIEHKPNCDWVRLTNK